MGRNRIELIENWILINRKFSNHNNSESENWIVKFINSKFIEYKFKIYFIQLFWKLCGKKFGERVFKWRILNSDLVLKVSFWCSNLNYFILKSKLIPNIQNKSNPTKMN